MKYTVKTTDGKELTTMKELQEHGIDSISMMPAHHGRGFDPAKVGVHDENMLVVVNYRS